MTEPRLVDPRFHVPERRVLALALFLAAVFWFARPVILPFVVGALIAYAFSPYIDRAQARTGRSRLLIVAPRIRRRAGHHRAARPRVLRPRSPARSRC